MMPEQYPAIPEQYWKKVNERRLLKERLGQAHFNTLQEMKPTLAEQIRGTDKDPFYIVSLFFLNHSECWTNYFNFLNENWA